MAMFFVALGLGVFASLAKAQEPTGQTYTTEEYFWCMENIGWNQNQAKGGAAPAMDNGQVMVYTTKDACDDASKSLQSLSDFGGCGQVHDFGTDDQYNTNLNHVTVSVEKSTQKILYFYGESEHPEGTKATDKVHADLGTVYQCRKENMLNKDWTTPVTGAELLAAIDAKPTDHNGIGKPTYSGSSLILETTLPNICSNTCQKIGRFDGVLDRNIYIRCNVGVYQSSQHSWTNTALLRYYGNVFGTGAGTVTPFGIKDSNAIAKCHAGDYASLVPSPDMYIQLRLYYKLGDDVEVTEKMIEKFERAINKALVRQGAGKTGKRLKLMIKLGIIDATRRALLNQLALDRGEIEFVPLVVTVKGMCRNCDPSLDTLPLDETERAALAEWIETNVFLEEEFQTEALSGVGNCEFNNELGLCYTTDLDKAIWKGALFEVVEYF